MLDRIKWFLNSWLFPVVVFGGLYLTGLHTPVVAFLQRGILATGLLQPEVLVEEAEETAGGDQLDFRMADATGRSMDGHELEGKVIFLNLWASWCPPCLAELPNIAALYKDYAGREDVAFVLLNVEEDVQKGLDLVARRGYDLPVYHLRGRLPVALQSGTLPSTYVIDASGRVVVRQTGMAQYDTPKFRALLDRLAADTATSGR